MSIGKMFLSHTIALRQILIQAVMRDYKDSKVLPYNTFAFLRIELEIIG